MHILHMYIFLLRELSCTSGPVCISLYDQGACACLHLHTHARYNPAALEPVNATVVDFLLLAKTGPALCEHYSYAFRINVPSRR